MSDYLQRIKSAYDYVAAHKVEAKRVAKILEIQVGIADCDKRPKNPGPNHKPKKHEYWGHGRFGAVYQRSERHSTGSHEDLEEWYEPAPGFYSWEDATVVLASATRVYIRRGTIEYAEILRYRSRMRIER